MTLLIYDPFFQEHETGTHPERPQRLQSIHEQLQKSGLLAQCPRGEFEPIPADDVCLVHDQDQFRRVEQVATEGGGRLDSDTVVSPQSFNVALAAAGACLAGVDAVMTGGHANALCLVRPPGHHANQTTSMGFCLFNSIALTADYAKRNYDLERILIVDFDVHHGNGTQDIFYSDASVTFCSIHRYGFGFYPGTGAKAETGTGEGLGHTFNAAVDFGTPKKEYHAHFRALLEKAAAKSRPQLVLLSAGFDAHFQDPIGSLGLETEDFATLTREVRHIANAHSGGRLVSCLEGGYHLQALAESVQAHLEELLTE